MDIIIFTVVSILSVIILWGAKWIIGKLNFSIENQIKALSIVKKGIDSAEHFATEYLQRYSKKVDSQSKLAVALNTIDKLLLDFPEVQKYIENKKVTMIEALLRSDLTPDSASPKSEKITNE